MKLRCCFLLLLVTYAFTLSAQSQKTISELRADMASFTRNGQTDEALKVNLRLIELYRKAKDTLEWINMYLHRGSICYSKSDYPLAINSYRAALEVIKQKKSVPEVLLFGLYQSFLTTYNEMNRVDSVRYFANSAYKLLRQFPSIEKRIPEYVINFYTTEGVRSYLEGDLERSKAYFDKSKVIGKNIQKSIYVALAESQLATFLQKKGDYSKADSLFRKILIDYTPKDIDRCWFLLATGKNSLLMKQYDFAKQYINLASSLYQTINHQNPEFEAYLYLRYGQLYARQRQDSAAVGAFQRAISISTKQYGKRGTVPAEAYRELAQLYRRKDQMPQALGAIQRALVAASTTFDSQDLGQNPNAEDFQLGVPLMEALHLKAELLLSAKRGAGALDTYRRYVEVALAVRREISSQESRLFFQQNRVDEVFNEAISLAFVRRDAEAAFWLIEQSRAATLHDRLSEQALKPRHIPAAVLKQENDLQGTIARLKMELSQGSNPQKEVALREAYLALEQLGLEWAQQYPEYFAERRAVTSLTLRALQKRLPNDMAYVAWHVAPNHLYTLIVTTQDTQLRVAQVSRRELDQQIVALRRALDQNPKVGAYAGSKPSQWLYAVLLKPIQATLQDTKRLVVSSNGKLNLLPIDVLEYVPGRYCVERFALSKAYNASIHFAEHGSDWLKTKPSLLVFAPFARPSGMQVGRGGDTLGPLPATLQECRKLGGTMYINQNAQKVDFLEAHRQKSTTSESVVYHFATHSVGNDAKPEASFVAFHPSPNAEYRLYSAEIKQLNLSNVRLAVLNSCSSAYGQLLENEGILSLARAFTEAGCRAVAAALWTQDDATGSAIAVSFHQYLAQGIPTDVALQKAKLDYLNNPPDDAFRDMRHPYFWGAMILSGHVEAVYESYLVWWWYGLGLAGLMGAGVWWWWRRRKLKGPVNNPQG